MKNKFKFDTIIAYFERENIMEKKLPKFLYRSIRLDYLDMYKNNPSAIPNLEGRNFKQFSYLNPFPYEDDVRYMHFFDEREMAKGYAADSSTNGKFVAPHIVCVFKFPEEILRTCRTDGLFGFYTKSGKDRFETHNEYIIPAELYDPAEHFVGVLQRSPMEKPNVYAVVRCDEVESYASDISSVYGREYMGEYVDLDAYTKTLLQSGEITFGSDNLKRVLEGFNGDTKAIIMYSKKQDAIYARNSHFSCSPTNTWNQYMAMDIMSGVNATFAASHQVIPFYVDQYILDMFKMGESKFYGQEYLIPIEYLIEANYYETGNDWLEDLEKPKEKQ